MSKKKTDHPTPRPYVLITNDDGIVAPGIAALICALQPTCDIIVVAPDGPRSGAGCSITSTHPIHYRIVNEEPGLRAYACSGTPVDCVKLALEALCERRPDLVVSGINLGNNASVCTYYSGTMGAVIESCIKGLPAIGFSLDTFDAAQADYSPCIEYVVTIAHHVLTHQMPARTYLNVNFPAVPELRGMRLCRMAMGDWVREFAPIDCPRGGNYYWMTGEYELHDKGTDTDMAALAAGYVSIVPQMLDVTSRFSIGSLRSLVREKKAKAKAAPAAQAPKEAQQDNGPTVVAPAADDVTTAMNINTTPMNMNTTAMNISTTPLDDEASATKKTRKPRTKKTTAEDTTPKTAEQPTPPETPEQPKKSKEPKTPKQSKAPKQPKSPKTPKQSKTPKQPKSPTETKATKKPATKSKTTKTAARTKKTKTATE